MDHVLLKPREIRCTLIMLSWTLCDHCEQKHREAFREANNACNTSVKSANLEERRKSCQDKVPEGPGISKSLGSSSVLLDPLLSYMVFS